MLEVFPLGDDSGNTRNIPLYNHVNASLCCAIADYGSALQSVTKTSSIHNTTQTESLEQHWVNSIFGFLLPQLDEISSLAQAETNTTSLNQTFNDTIKNETYLQDKTTSTLLSVIKRLLLPIGNTQEESFLLHNIYDRHTLLTSFGGAFFPHNNNNAHEDININKGSEHDETTIDSKFCSSLAGRDAATLLAVLLSYHLASFDTSLNPNDPNLNQMNKYKSQLPIILANMATVLPLYLHSWKGSFPFETRFVLSSLISVISLNEIEHEHEIHENICPVRNARRILASSLRQSLPLLFETTKLKKTLDKRQDPILSTFEHFDNTSQRIVLGIIGMLRCPAHELVAFLADICARCRCNDSIWGGISADVADYTMNVMNNIRQTIPMWTYLTFLINSIGISSKRSGNKRRREELEKKTQYSKNVEAKKIFLSKMDKKHIFSKDMNLTRCCHYLIQCGWKRVLPKLIPILSLWLNGGGLNKEPFSAEAILKARAAIFIISCCVLDGLVDLNASIHVLDDHGHNEITLSYLCIYNLIPDVVIKIEDVICNVFMCVPLSFDDNGKVMPTDFLNAFLGPIQALMSCQPLLTKNVIKRVTKSVESLKECNHARNESILHCLVCLVQSDQMFNVLRLEIVSDCLFDSVKSIEIKMKNGPLEDISSILMVHVQALHG
mmetsp:Transcript_11903/g.16921  ORF Transcript_11903/g.16921 Transcript_11903/m.16921 type:complete len:667 (-) Transcript_11903:383-2383(-)